MTALRICAHVTTVKSLHALNVQSRVRFVVEPFVDVVMNRRYLLATTATASLRIVESVELDKILKAGFCATRAENLFVNCAMSIGQRKATTIGT